jgi:hypothetical protein
MHRHAGKHRRALGAGLLAGVLLSLLLAASGLSSALAAAGVSPARLTFAASSSTGGANHLLLLRSGGELQLLDLDTHRVLRRRPFALTTAMSIAGANGRVNNTLTLDFSGGSLAVPGGIAFDGGRGGYNTLDLRGGRFARQRHVAYGPHSGLITLDATTVHYTDIAPIIDTTPSSASEIHIAEPGAEIKVEDGAPVAGVHTTRVYGGVSAKFEQITFANKTHVTISALQGGDVFTFDNPNPAQGLVSVLLKGAANESTTFGATATAVPLTIEGAGTDTVNLGSGSLQALLAQVTVNDPLGFASLSVDDSSDPTGRAASITTDGTNDTISGLSPAPIVGEVFGLSSLAVSGGTGNNTFSYGGAGTAVAATLNTGAGSDTTHVLASTPEGPLTIHGQNGSDTVMIGNGGSARGIAAAVSLDNTLGATTLAIDDSADTAARSVTVASNGVFGMAPGGVNYANVPSLNVRGGAPSDFFSVAPSAKTSYTLAGGGSPAAAAPGNTLSMVLTTAGSPALSASPTSGGVQGQWSFSNRRPVLFSGMHSLNPTLLAVSDAAATVGASGLSPLQFTASLLAPSTQPVTVSYATTDGTATAASGAYQAASGSIGFAPGTTTQPIAVNALGTFAFRPTQTMSLNLASPVGALLTRSSGTGTIADNAAPIVGSLSQTRRVWRAGNGAARVSAAAARAAVGTTFAFTLSQPASVSFAFTQQLGGRRVGSRCVAPTGSNRHRRACVRTVTRGTLSFAGRGGANRVSFQGRLSRARRLAPGRYTLVVIAANAAGRRSGAQRLSFTIIR